MANKFSPSLFIITQILTIVFYQAIHVTSCRSAFQELSGAVKAVSHDVSSTLKDTSNKLSRSIDKGVEATAATVRELAGSVTEMAKSVSVRIDSGDLSHIGNDATKNIRDALVELSRNWNLAVSTADLKDFGAEAARSLSEAIQNVNIKININFGIDDNMVTAIGYISIAVGIAFSVCFVAIVISIKQCRSCTVSLITGCVEGCCVCRNSNSTIQMQPTSSQARDTELKVFIKENNVSAPDEGNNNDKNRNSETLKGKEFK